MCFRWVFLVIMVLDLLGVLAQDCRFYGQSCSDDYSCCGGCCLKGICKDTYLDCRRRTEDPCMNRYCPEDQVCFTYQPPGCKGCGLLVECRSVPVPKEFKENRTLTHYHLLNNSASLKFKLYFLNVCLIILALFNW